jgi:cytochrome c oxidase assembly protein subunit 15
MVSAQEYLGGLLPMADRMAIQILHRLVACLLILSALFTCLRLLKTKHKKLIWLIILPLSLQVLIGIANVILLLPLPLALLHNTGAAILWLCLWRVYFTLAESTSEATDE